MESANNNKKKKVSSPGFGIVAHPDGTITRLDVPKVSASSSSFTEGAASKDVTIHPPTGLWARIFLPAPQSSPSKLPVLLYFHGGGFVMMSVAYRFYHSFFLRLCKSANVIVIAVEYRLAPEHRLPAAHEDALVSLQWLQSQASIQQQGKSVLTLDSMSSIQSSPEPWLGEFADFSRCYLMGDSAGGTMVHFLSLRVAEGLDIIPLRVCGQIIVQPFFGGQERTATELRLVNDEYVPLSGTDWLWRTCLPAGADRDHPLANSFGPSSPDLKPLARSLPPILFIVASGDPMLERQMKVFETLREGGSQIRLLSYQGSHGSQLQSRTISESLFKDVASFIQSPLAFLSKL